MNKNIKKVVYIEWSPVTFRRLVQSSKYRHKFLNNDDLETFQKELPERTHEYVINAVCKYSNMLILRDNIVLYLRITWHVAVAQWLRASNIFRQLCSSTSEWRGSSPAVSVGRDLNLQKLHYQYLTTSVAVVLVVR